jgi:hypothetical protein
MNRSDEEIQDSSDGISDTTHIYIMKWKLVPESNSLRMAVIFLLTSFPKITMNPLETSPPPTSQIIMPLTRATLLSISSF